MSSLGVEYGTKYTLTGPDGTVVTFNDSTDPNFIGLISPESSGLDGAEVREDAQDSTEADGGVHGSFWFGRRPVILIGTIIASGKTQRNERVGKLKRCLLKAMRKDAVLKWKPEGASAEVELKLRLQQRLAITKAFVKDFMLPMVSADAAVCAVTITKVNNVPTNTFMSSGATHGLTTGGGFIYFGRNLEEGYISRAKIDGTSIETKWSVSKIGFNHGYELDAKYLYFQVEGKIGRINLNGTELNTSFIATAAGGVSYNIGVNASFIYWANGKHIGRATIAGGEILPEFVKEVGEELMAVTVDSKYIYWADYKGGNIGRCLLNGTSVEKTWITFPSAPKGVSTNGTRIYWSEFTGGGLGSAKIDGTDAKEETTIPNTIYGVEATSEYVYWAGETGGVGRMALSLEATNNGDNSAYPTIKVNGAQTNPVLENVTTGEKITLEYTLPSGKYLLIDFKNHTIKLDGVTNVYTALVFGSSTWWALEPGVTKLNLPQGSEVEFRDTFL